MKQMQPIAAVRIVLAVAAMCAAAAVQAALIGTLSGTSAAQSALTAEGHDRVSTEFFVDLHPTALADLGAAAALASPLRAAGGAVGVQYLGTQAAPLGQLFLAEGSHPALFETRDALGAAAAIDDFSAVIDSIGLQRSITGISAGAPLVFGLNLLAFTPDGSASALPAHAGSTVLTSDANAVRALDLGSGTWLIGFEAWGGVDYSDALMLVSGATLQAPDDNDDDVDPVGNGVPLPSGLVLAGLGLLLAAAVRRR